MGFVQVFAGTMLIMVPHPIVQSIGGGLVTSGIGCFIVDAADKGYLPSNQNNYERFPRFGKGPLPYN